VEQSEGEKAGLAGETAAYGKKGIVRHVCQNEELEPGYPVGPELSLRTNQLDFKLKCPAECQTGLTSILQTHKVTRRAALKAAFQASRTPSS